MRRQVRHREEPAARADRLDDRRPDPPLVERRRPARRHLSQHARHVRIAEHRPRPRRSAARQQPASLAVELRRAVRPLPRDHRRHREPVLGQPDRRAQRRCQVAPAPARHRVGPARRRRPARSPRAGCPTRAPGRSPPTLAPTRASGRPGRARCRSAPRPCRAPRRRTARSSRPRSRSTSAPRPPAPPPSRPRRRPRCPRPVARPAPPARPAAATPPPSPGAPAPAIAATRT